MKLWLPPVGQEMVFAHGFRSNGAPRRSVERDEMGGGDMLVKGGPVPVNLVEQDVAVFFRKRHQDVEAQAAGLAVERGLRIRGNQPDEALALLRLDVERNRDEIGLWAHLGETLACWRG